MTTHNQPPSDLATPVYTYHTPHESHFYDLVEGLLLIWPAFSLADARIALVGQNAVMADQMRDVVERGLHLANKSFTTNLALHEIRVEEGARVRWMEAIDAWRIRGQLWSHLWVHEPGKCDAEFMDVLHLGHRVHASG